MSNGSCKKEKWKLVVIFYGLESWIDNEDNTWKAVMEWSNGMKNDIASNLDGSLHTTKDKGNTFQTVKTSEITF